MPRGIRGTAPLRSSITLDLDSWLAGILDATGRFYLWANGAGRWQVRVTIAVDGAVAHRFAALTGLRLRHVDGNRYQLPARELLPLLIRVLPRMICLHEEGSMVYRYLITKHGRKSMSDGKLSEAVVAYRRELCTKLRARR